MELWRSREEKCSHKAASTGLSCRPFTSVVPGTSSDAAGFLRRERGCAKLCGGSGPSAKKALATSKMSLPGLSKRDKVVGGEVLDSTETTHTEFKNFTEDILEYIRKTLPNYVSAFKEALEKTVADTMGAVLVHHFCSSQAVTGSKDGKWIELMTAADPDLSDLADEFENELSLANGPPLTKPIYSKAGLQCVSELQKGLYPVCSNEIKWKPETICTDLFSEYPGLEDLTKKQIHPLNKGILVFSRSWVVDTGLPKPQDVVCDVLLVAGNVYPVLYTVVKDASSAESENSRETAYALKQKLGSDGAYASKMSVIPQILHLNDTKNQMEVPENDVPQQESLACAEPIRWNKCFHRENDTASCS
uniref:Schlafen GTPase-like domain-containing protein n=1 Tax=Bubo bubo TaxID=30461 RepID=A0A8C0ICD9_BUBBB